jgi:hypothetical protein
MIVRVLRWAAEFGEVNKMLIKKRENFRQLEERLIRSNAARLFAHMLVSMLRQA